MIEAAITFHPAFPVWIILCSGTLILLLLVWKEVQRKIKFFVGRLVAVFFLIFSLIALLLRPTLVNEKKSTGIVLLTQHYQASLADSLRKANPKLTFLRTSDAKPYPQAEVLSSYDLSSIGKEIHFVLGDGLPYYSLQEVKSDFQFLQGELPLGIIEWNSSSSFKANQKTEISGRIRVQRKSKIKLVSPVGIEDSVECKTKGVHPFKLSFTPSQTGLFVYSIVVEDSAGTTIQNFPLDVIPEKKMNILFIQSYPTAEVKYLKNFLIEKGHALAVRTQTSKNNFRYEYGNRESLKVEKLSSEILNDIDLLIIDSESITSLNAYEKNILEESVKQGLGLLLLYNGIDKKRSTSFLSLPIKEAKSDTVHLLLGKSRYTLPTLPIEIAAENIESITKSKERVLAGCIMKGAGKIGFQLLQETYRLILLEKSLDYAKVWSPLIERVARVQSSGFKVELEQSFPIYLDEPLNVNVIASQPNPLLSSDNVLLPLREDVVIDDYWHGTTWAGAVGWHHFSIEQDSTKRNYYISDKKEWQSLRIAQQQRANEIHSTTKKYSSRSPLLFTEHKEISPVFFFLLFLLSFGFLWLAPKI